MFTFSHSSHCALTAWLWGTVLIAGPGLATLSGPAQGTEFPGARSGLAQTSPAETGQSPAAEPSAKASRAKFSAIERVEARITDLHAKLGITPAQEAQWDAVAQVMRENAGAIETLHRQRAQARGTSSALDDLRSSESLAETHADGLKKLVAAFQPLYDGMSDDQKKQTDAIFQERPHARSHHHGGKGRDQ